MVSLSRLSVGSQAPRSGRQRLVVRGRESGRRLHEALARRRGKSALAQQGLTVVVRLAPSVGSSPFVHTAPSCSPDVFFFSTCSDQPAPSSLEFLWLGTRCRKWWETSGSSCRTGLSVRTRGTSQTHTHTLWDDRAVPCLIFCRGQVLVDVRPEEQGLARRRTQTASRWTCDCVIPLARSLSGVRTNPTLSFQDGIRPSFSNAVTTLCNTMN